MKKFFARRRARLFTRLLHSSLFYMDIARDVYTGDVVGFRPVFDFGYGYTVFDPKFQPLPPAYVEADEQPRRTEALN